MFDRNTILAVVLVLVVAVCGWLWLQATHMPQTQADEWIKVLRALLEKPRWYEKEHPTFVDYRKPPEFDAYELIADTLPRFYAPMADRRAQFKVILSRKDGRGNEVYVLVMEDRGALWLSDWRPVLFLPERDVKKRRR